jgi:hypothetical protein
VVVKPVKERKKRCRGRNSTAGRRGEPKELTRGNCGYQRKLAAAFRKVSRRAKAAWRKRHLIRQIGTEDNYGPRSKLTAAGRRMTRYAGVACLRRDIIRKECTRTKEERATQREGPLRKNLRKKWNKWSRRQAVARRKKEDGYRERRRKWTLWRGRPPPKRKKRSCNE